MKKTFYSLKNEIIESPKWMDFLKGSKNLSTLMTQLFHFSTNEKSHQSNLISLALFSIIEKSQ